MSGVLAYRAGGSGRRQLQWLDRTGTVRGEVGAPDDNVINTTGFLSRAPYAVGTGGRFLMNVDVDEDLSPFSIVLNWEAALKRR
jgi:hypothetical protein